MLFEQLEQSLNGEFESVDAMKASIKGMLPAIQGAFDRNKETTRELGKKYDASLQRISGIQSTLGLENDFTNDDISGVLNGFKTQNDTDYDAKLNAEIDKYKKEFNDQLTLANQDAETAKSELGLFKHKSAIDASGLLKDIRDETPLFKEQALNYIMNKTIVVDGQLYANDGDGKPALNFQSKDDSDKYLGGDFVVSKMKDDAVYAPLFKNPQKANGMNTNPQQSNANNYSQQTRTSLSKISDGLRK